jgi:hypothetical protein
MAIRLYIRHSGLRVCAEEVSEDGLVYKPGPRYRVQMGYVSDGKWHIRVHRTAIEIRSLRSLVFRPVMC